MEKLVITVTYWNVIIEYNGDHGVTTAYRNYRRYNGQFNFGYSGSGPATLVTALLEVLYMDNEEVQDYRQWKGIAHIKGYEIINNVIVSPKEKPGNEQSQGLCEQLVVDVTEEMIAIFPFLQQKKDHFGTFSRLLNEADGTTSISFFVSFINTTYKQFVY